MKHLPKHLRPRYRYLGVAIESWPDVEFDRGAFQRELWYAAQNLLGDAGSAELDLRVLGFAFAGGDGTAVVRTRRGEEGRARAVLACLGEVDGEPVGVHVRGMSGTVRACEEKHLEGWTPENPNLREENYIRRPLESPNERTVAFADAERRAVERGGRLDVHTPDGFAGATQLDID